MPKQFSTRNDCMLLSQGLSSGCKLQFMLPFLIVSFARTVVGAGGWTWNAKHFVQRKLGLQKGLWWKTDGPRGVLSFGPNEESLVTIGRYDCDEHNMINMMVLADGNFPKSYWFEVNIHEIEELMSVGVVTPDEFHRGYRITGMFYNGNLSNGGCALICGYGPYLRSGGTRCVLECKSNPSVVDKDGSVVVPPTFSMTIYVNGSRIGKAFEIVNPPSKGFFPCVKITGRARFSAKVLPNEPPDLMESTVANQNALVGKWKIVQAISAVSGSDISGNRHWGMRIDIQTDPEVVHDPKIIFAIRVVNKMGCARSFQERKSGTTVYYNLSGEAKFYSTLMGSSPELMRIEQAMASAVGDWESIRYLPQDDTLEMLSCNGTVVARCVRDTTERKERPTLTDYHDSGYRGSMDQL